MLSIAKNRTSSRITAAMISAAMTLAHVPAFAQSDEDKAAARKFAGEGAKAVDEKRWNDAIDYFTRAESLFHTPTHLLFLARSYEGAGKLVKAREAYLKIVKEELAPTAPKAFKDAKTAAADELAKLEPRIPNLKIVVAGGDGKTVSVTMDGVNVPPALVGVSRPVDPGEHNVSATAEGLAANGKITVKEGGEETITLTLEKTSGGAATPAPDTKSPPDQPPPVTTPSEGMSSMRLGAFVGLGVGVVGLGVGTIFLLRASGKRSDADDLCVGGVCPRERAAEIADLDSQAKSARTIGTIGVVVGGLGLATGVTLFILSAGDDKKTTTGLRVTPQFGLGSIGLSGAF